MFLNVQYVCVVEDPWYLSDTCVIISFSVGWQYSTALQCSSV